MNDMDFGPSARFSFAAAASTRSTLMTLTALILAWCALPLRAQSPGLVAAYGFEEGSGASVVDSSGNSNTGTLGAGVSRSTQGRLGSALAFNGNGMVTVPSSSSLNLTSAMTLEAWVFPTSSSSSYLTVLMKEQTSHFAYTLYSSSTAGRPNVYFNSSTASNGQHGVAATSGLPVNTWSHLAGAYDGSNLRLYVNGSLAATLAVTAPIQSSAGALRLGGNSLWGEFFTGRIDEVRIYGRALSPAEIQSDMSSPVGGSP